VALLDIVLGYDCNLACDYCTITPAMRQRSLSTKQVLQALSDGRAGGYDAVSFTGGEPTIRADLVGLIKAARACGYGDIKVQSNGLLFSHAPNVDALVRAGVTRFHQSIHTHDPAAYDALVQREGSYPLMVAGLDNLVSRGLGPVADVILKTDTYRKLPDALAWLYARGVRTAHLWFVSLTDGNRDNVHSMPRMTEVLPLMRQGFAFARARGMELRSLHVPRCLLGDDAPHALDPGAGQVRVVTPEATFELRQSRLGGQQYVPVCDGCPHRAICPGIRADYLARYGDGEFTAARSPA
jgi:cyclic pyranopterin phosphate synthase